MKENKEYFILWYVAILCVTVILIAINAMFIMFMIEHSDGSPDAMLATEMFGVVTQTLILTLMIAFTKYTEILAPLGYKPLISTILNAMVLLPMIKFMLW